MEEPPSVSVIIATYNRPQTLVETVSSFLDQEYPASEIIVVDQSEEVTERIKRFFSQDHAVKLKYLRVDKPNLPEARNIGIRQAVGEVVLFVDDDVVPLQNDFIFSHVMNYADPRVVAVAGRVIEDGSEVHDKPALKFTKWGTIKGNPNSTMRAWADTMKGCNMSVKKKAAIRAGMFSKEIAGTAQFEDAEFALRLQKVSGKQIVFDPEAVLYHKRVPIGGCGSRQVSSLERHFWRFHNMTVACLRNPRRINPFFFLLGRLVSALKIAVMMRDLSAPFWLIAAVMFGARTYFREEISEETLSFVSTHV